MEVEWRGIVGDDDGRCARLVFLVFVLRTIFLWESV